MIKVYARLPTDDEVREMRINERTPILIIEGEDDVDIYPADRISIDIVRDNGRCRMVVCPRE